MEIGKERYKLFKHRYYIKIENVTNYYYDKYFFVRAIIQNVDELGLGVVDELEINSLLNRIL